MMEITKWDIVDLYLKNREDYWKKGGSYSNVFIPKDNKKTKVIKVNEEFDNGYYYCLWCMEEPAWWKPKVHMVQCFQSPLYHSSNNKYTREKDSYLVVMDKCLPLPEESKTEYDLWWLKSGYPMVFSQLNKWANKQGVKCLDIHSHNVMLHPKTNQIVITDPVV
jgi:hypothetical protein